MNDNKTIRELESYLKAIHNKDTHYIAATFTSTSSNFAALPSGEIECILKTKLAIRSPKL